MYFKISDLYTTLSIHCYIVMRSFKMQVTPNVGIQHFTGARTMHTLTDKLISENYRYKSSLHLQFFNVGDFFGVHIGIKLMKPVESRPD